MEEITAAATDLEGLLTVAELLVSQPDTDTPAMISGGGVVTVSSPAWNTAAAYAVTDAHAGVRHLENGLRRKITGSHLARGGSDNNTTAALGAIVSLSAGLDPHVYTPRTPDGDGPCYCPRCRVRRLLFRWSNLIRMLPAIDQAVRWQVIRSADGRPVLCEYCQTPSLRAAPDHYLVACGNPECRDSNGDPPVARMELSAMTGEGILAWRDGRVT